LYGILGHMVLLHEKVLLPGGLLEIELHSDRQYRLHYADIEYQNDRRKIGARTTPYEFRSVEQLRYDFERDVRAAGGSLG
jgi:hypothetical protein